MSVGNGEIEKDDVCKSERELCLCVSGYKRLTLACYLVKMLWLLWYKLGDCDMRHLETLLYLTNVFYEIKGQDDYFLF